jgi:hypothetical protein
MFNTGGPRPWMLFVLFSMLSTSAAPAGTVDDLEPVAGVRTADRRIQLALEAGAERSAIFSSLLAAIAHSDVIVYVEDGRCARAQPDGCVLFAAASGGWRYVRVRVGAKRPLAQLVQILGHELHHALEIAHAPEVVDATTLVALYQRIGIKSRGTLCAYETLAAVRTGDAVLAEFNDSLAATRRRQQ